MKKQKKLKQMEYLAHYSQQRKEKQLLNEHLMNVSRIASNLAAKISCPETAKTLGLLHDLGKYSSTFQDYIKSATGLSEDTSEQIDYENQKGKIDHSSAGAQLVWNELTKKDNDIKRQIYSQFLALCIASHHSGLIDCLTPDGEDGFTKRMQKNIEFTYYEEVLKNADKEIIEKVNDLLSNDKAYQEFLSIISIISQNKKNNSELIKRFQAGLLLKFMFSCLIDADRTDTADFETPINKRRRQFGDYISWDILVERFEEHLKALENKSDKNKINECNKRKENEKHCSHIHSKLNPLTCSVGNGIKDIFTNIFLFYFNGFINLLRLGYQNFGNNHHAGSCHH